MSRRLLLGAFVLHPSGLHASGWRHPRAEPHRHVDIDAYAHLAAVAERGIFDTLVLADGQYLPDRAPSLEHSGQTRLEPLTVLAALAVRTRHIGLAATVSPRHNEPYHVARALASLDHISRGRAGWNVVTSRYPEEDGNFGGGGSDHAVRYERTAEFVDVVRQLWDSWADDAILADRESGLFADADRLTVPDHRGAHFAVRGPLNVSRPPQGHPVVFQAVGSDAGADLAAAAADVVIVHGVPLAAADAFARDLRARVGAHGRPSGDVAILPTLRPVVAETAADAEDLAAAILASTPDAIIVDDIARSIGQALPADPDAPIVAADGDAASPSNDRIARLRAGERPTPRALYAESFRDAVTVGRPESVADHIQEHFDSGAADGFLVAGLTEPHGIESFVDLVVPELQRRGLTRTTYEETTLRERLGLIRPERRVRDRVAS